MNDFKEEAALSCIRQDYSLFHVFLLDDSTDPEFQRRVDTFHARFPHATTVIRRRTRRGYKAGNLNHALDLISATYEFFAVSDADGILPPDFLSRLLPYFRSPNVGFVQACQRSHRSANLRPFAADLSVSTDVYWNYVVPVSSRFGFLMFHGHGAVIRMTVWRAIGGFPRLIAEDLGFSTLAREKGYFGIFVKDVVCDEEFPPSYAAFVRRQTKYVTGAVEHLMRYMPRFLLCRGVPWFEKCDRLLASAALASPFMWAAFMANLTFVARVSTQEGGPWGGSLLGNGGVYNPLAWLTYSLLVFSLVAPALEAAFVMVGSRKCLLRLTSGLILAHLGLIISVVVRMVVILLRRRGSFPVTGDLTREACGKEGRYTCLECVIWSAGLFGLVLFSGPMAVTWLSIGLAWLSGIVSKELGWEHLFARVLRHSTGTTLLLIVALQPAVAAGLIGAPMLAAAGMF